MTAAQPPRDQIAPPPNWDLVRFDVSCARCGHDLRGQIEPKCAACGLEFDWAEAVPLEQLTCSHCGYHLYGLIEPRCPECGKPFTWAAALARFRTKQTELFEYRWRDRPVHSLLSTWWQGVWPTSFWRARNIHEEPQILPLVVMIIIGLFLMTIAMPTVSGILHSVVFVYITQGSWDWGVLTIFIRHFLESTWQKIAYSGIHVVLLWTPLWQLNCLLTLLVFRQSHRIFKVRSRQVVRIWAYCVWTRPLEYMIGVFPVELAFSLISLDFYEMLAPLLMISATGYVNVHAMWSCRQAHKYYLRMPHSLATACVWIVISFMATFELLLIWLLWL